MIIMFFAAILAGGIGTRLDVGVPKQFYEINGKPLLAYCIEPFTEVDMLDRIIVSSPKDYMDRTHDLVDEYFDDDRIAVIEGGETRNGTILNSIYYALENGADENSVLTTHDGARIFVTPKLIEDSLILADEIKLLDEAMMLFYLRDKPVHLFEGDSANFKVTRPFDITIAETILNK